MQNSCSNYNLKGDRYPYLGFLNFIAQLQLSIFALNFAAYPYQNQDASEPVDNPTEAERQQVGDCNYD